MTDLHPLDLMNAVPADGDIPRGIVALAQGCTCYGDEHVPGGCSGGRPLAVDVEAYRNIRALNGELVAALEFVIAESDDPTVAQHAAKVLRRLRLRD